MTDKLTLKDISFQGKKALIRVDFNVPLSSDGKIEDNTRIKESIPTIKYILRQGGSVILMSHLGRPKGKKESRYSLLSCVKELASLLEMEVKFVEDCMGPNVEKAAKNLKPGEILLLENLRFYEAEENPEKDLSFAQKLAKLGDIFVNDAFGAAHRAHSSTTIIAKYFPQSSVMGFLMKKEVSFLSNLLQNPKRPFYAIIGGSKISTKLGVLESLIGKVDGLFIGGAMAFTFFKAQGLSIGDSLCEVELIPQALRFLNTAKKKQTKVFFPVDSLIADSLQEKAHTKLIHTEDGIPSGWKGVDIGPETIKNWESTITNAATIFWNGPLGIFEVPSFANGTFSIAKTLASLHATTIVGGGNSCSAVNKLGIGENFTHISTGGGASLEFLEFGYLPGIHALSDKN